MTSGFLKGPRSENTLVPGISKPKIPLVSYSSCFISQFIHPICWIQGISSAMVYFAFAEFIFSLRDTPTIACPSAAAVSDCALLLSLNCNHSELQWSEGREDVSQHGVPWSWWQVYTRGLGGLLIGWSCQNQCALLVPKFKFQPGETRKKSRFTSKAPTTSHSPAPVETWKHWLPTQQDGGSPSTPSFHSSPFSLL